VTGDFTRITFRPERRYSGVRMQQGRMQVDADFNEEAQIRDHLERKRTTDVVGACGVPIDRPHRHRHHRKAVGGGFAIGHTRDRTDLTIAPGRMYVDGILCELEVPSTAITGFRQPDTITIDDLTPGGHKFAQGDEVELFGPHGRALAAEVTAVDDQAGTLTLDIDGLDAFETDVKEPRLRLATTYGVQPYDPDPEPLDPTSPHHDLVYLDVWERHVGAVEEPRLLDPALGGRDTSSRVQTVWQVKVMQVPDGVTCDDDIDGWPPPTSGGRLTSNTVPGGASDDPCIVPPGGGYTGLENRLYRVEVHDGSDPGPPNFKWSRDNGSATFAIDEFVNGGGGATDQVRLRRLDRAGVRSLTIDDWVEILDDGSELTSRPPSRLVRVTDVDELERIVTLSATVAGYDIARHARLRRWDQATDPILIDAAIDQALEDGITVRFAGDDFLHGDYWTFAARTAIGDIERLENAAPEGVTHHYCKLALVSWERRTDAANAVCQISTVEDDCRALFPPLTDVCAEDVCFDNTLCELPDTETVQEALERLCEEQNLRFHNRHLHGWGVVCGLEVHCDEKYCDSVVVETGYALDVDGRDLVLRTPRRVDVIEKLAGSNGSPVADGEYALSIGLDEDFGITFDVEPYEHPDDPLAAILKGTLAYEIWDECVGALIEIFREELDPDSDEANGGLVTAGQKRLTTLLNLLIQLVNPTDGRYVFLSEKEHDILRRLYERLRDALRSPTFCAMFKGDRGLPDYPFGKQPSTIFGRTFDTRVRVNPSATRAYTMGGGNAIGVFDLALEEMVDELIFPGPSDVVVQDVVFTGSRTFCAVALHDGDTLFAVADPGPGRSWQWRSQTTTICDVELVTLGNAGTIYDRVYAVGRGKGLYEIDPESPDPNPEPLAPFNAFGHLVIVEERGAGIDAVAYATAYDGETPGPPTFYDAFVRVPLPGGTDFLTTPLLVANPANGGQVKVSGDDDLAVALGETTSKVYVVARVADAQGNESKAILAYDLGSASPADAAIIGGLEMTAIRLAYNGQTEHVVVSFSDSYRLGLVDAGTDELLPEYRHPVQIDPVALAWASEGNAVYALNFASRTLTTIPASLLPGDTPFDVERLAQYRDDVIEAFADLLAATFQYLKDCFCDHLLPKCPERDGEKVYLAGVEVRDEDVYAICNFTERRHVKTFPTVERWLSLVPVLPLLDVFVEKLCCLILPEYSHRYVVAAPSKTTHRLGARRMHEAVALGRRVDIGVASRRLFRTVDFGRVAAARFFAGEDVGDARTLTDLPRLAARLSPAAARREHEDVRSEIEAVRTDVSRVERSYRRALASRDKEIKSLQARLEAIER
jgi:hypothetical protein